MALAVVTLPPLRVLVVDDSAYNRKNIAEILGGRDDVEVVGKAGDGDEALRLVSQLKPDAITLDLEMPKMDGFTFLRILMAKQPTPVIVVSSYSNKENVFKALELGAIDFVAKPDRQFQPDPAIRNEILSKVLLVRNLRPLASLAARAGGHARSLARSPDTVPRANVVPRYVVGIASSTGGPSRCWRCSPASRSASPARSSSPSTCRTSSPAPSPSGSTRRVRCASSRLRTTTP